MKDIKDYLHLYLGQSVQILDKSTQKWSGWKIITPDVLKRFYESELSNFNVNLSFRLSLRPLSDMTEEERKEVGFDAYQMLRNEHGGRVIPSKEKGFIWAAKQTTYLLKQGFDLFGLIESGLAIDKTILETTQTN